MTTFITGDDNCVRLTALVHAELAVPIYSLAVPEPGLDMTAGISHVATLLPAAKPETLNSLPHIKIMRFLHEETSFSEE